MSEKKGKPTGSREWNPLDMIPTPGAVLARLRETELLLARLNVLLEAARLAEASRESVEKTQHERHEPVPTPRLVVPRRKSLEDHTLEELAYLLLIAVQGGDNSTVLLLSRLVRERAEQLPVNEDDSEPETPAPPPG